MARMYGVFSPDEETGSAEKNLANIQRRAGKQLRRRFTIFGESNGLRKAILKKSPKRNIGKPSCNSLVLLRITRGDFRPVGHKARTAIFANKAAGIAQSPSNAPGLLH